MKDHEPLNEFIRSIGRLGLSAEDKQFLIDVRKQFEAELLMACESDVDRDDPPAGSRLAPSGPSQILDPGRSGQSY
jgi:hypothetical protein